MIVSAGAAQGLVVSSYVLTDQSYGFLYEARQKNKHKTECGLWQGPVCKLQSFTVAIQLPLY